jgi:hypothetical protein
MTAPVVFNIENALASLSLILGTEDEPATVTYNGVQFKANVVSDVPAKVVS